MCIKEAFRLNRLANESQKRTSSITVAARNEERAMTVSECMIVAHEAVVAFRIRHPENNTPYRKLLGVEIKKAFKSRKRYENHSKKVIKFYNGSKSLAMGA